MLVIDSSEGYTCWQEKTIKWVRDTYGDTVKIGAGILDPGESWSCNLSTSFVR